MVLPTNMSELVPIESIEIFGNLGVSPELVCEFVVYNWDGIDNTYQYVSPTMNTFSEMVELALSEETDEGTVVPDIDAYFQSNVPEIYTELVRIKSTLEPYLGDIPCGLDCGGVQQINVQSSDFNDDHSPLMVQLFVEG